MNKTIPILLLLLFFGAAAWYFLMAEPAEVHELPSSLLVPVKTTAEPQIIPEPKDIEAYVEPEPEIIPDPLPSLNESDPEITRALAAMVGAKALQAYLVKSDIISRFVTTIDSLAYRQVPIQGNPVRSAPGSFKTHDEGENIVLSEENFARYDGYVALIDTAGTDVIMTFYQRYRPLFQQAWEENGHEGSFNQRLVEVIDELLATPDVPRPVYLTKPEAVYLYAQAELESMTAGQKILVRMGSANAAVVKEKLTEIKLHVNGL